MAQYSTHNFTDELRSRLSVVDVVGKYVPLKKKGNQYWGCCPFHREKTASFAVSPQRECYHCFGCGEHGDIVSFVMRYLHVDFKQAIKELADMAGIPVPSERKQSDKFIQKRNKYYELYETATKIYERQLQTKAGAEALEYLKGRGFSIDDIKRYRIGFAPNSNILTEKFIAEEASALESTGLVRNGEQSRYDFFRNRIMFPIMDASGKTIAFSGRSLDGSGPKYVNSCDTEFFHKRRTLFGLNYAKNSIYRSNRSFLVEGQIDAIKMQLAGYEETVAPLGSALTAEHIGILCKHNRNIIMCFDGDTAGRNAAYKASMLCLPFMKANADIRVVFLPDGEDPDSVLSQPKGKLEMDACLGTSMSIFEFLWEHIVAKHDYRETRGRTAIIREIRETLNLIEDLEFRKDLKVDFGFKIMRRFYSKKGFLALSKRLV